MKSRIVLLEVGKLVAVKQVNVKIMVNGVCHHHNHFYHAVDLIESKLNSSKTYGIFIISTNSARLQRKILAACCAETNKTNNLF